MPAYFFILVPGNLPPEDIGQKLRPQANPENEFAGLNCLFDKLFFLIDVHWSAHDHQQVKLIKSRQLSALKKQTPRNRMALFPGPGFNISRAFKRNML